MVSRKEITATIGAVKKEKRETPAKISEYFGKSTFSECTMKTMVSGTTFRAFKKWQSGGKVISSSHANEIANAMKAWAISSGATSYSHWFQPMTGLTAEKHDSFIKLNGTGQVLEEFSGSELIQGEPDASSFPSGGLRTTFEARGYTAWDPSSPAFITEVDLGKTLCIPSIYISYTGQSLDKKLPLLHSEEAINNAALGLMKLFGNTEAKMVYPTCGAEQEFFLIDSKYGKLRSDIMLTGRTLVGAASPKDQQLEDQYFGSIKDRILYYMNEVAEHVYKLGIPLATRHNEVAPHQYEFAPVFERSNLAADHNQLLMDVMKQVANHHGLECLLHEKPFEGINGSGKHINWSLADDEGNNLLNPGDTPEDNLQFLTLLVAVIHAVYKHSDLLRAAIVSAGNEHRLGGYEAPPAIISVFVGKQLRRLLENIVKGKKKKITKADIIDFGIGRLPNLPRDITDRNRTSPFAFTGTKFEFRPLGSSMNISTALTIINTIVADSISHLVSKITRQKKQGDFTSAVLNVLSETINESKPVLFEGNNYSKEWLKEAEKRGLENESSPPKALKALIKTQNIKLFEKHGIFTKDELEARYNAWLDIYNKILDIEGKTLLEIVNTQVLPAAYDFQIEAGNSLDVLKEMADDETIPIPIHAVDDRKEMFTNLTNDIYYIRRNVKELAERLKFAEKLETKEMAKYMSEQIKPLMDHVRRHVDDLESSMPDDQWLLPKYREMLFVD